ncbi:serine carboxypeptidase-like 17 [Humulus lupulus]|uniref:serine carboxypeptidase-like 17 n=1 Tax=Humulus lupulus TaxID=3486 RepID=UPI002B403AE3|nr:serine carboxypeptidase-like 17 [Humulus lupulus]
MARQSYVVLSPILVWNHHIRLLLVLILLDAFSERLAVAASTTTNTLKFLPGFQGPLPFHLETGYVGVGESEEAQVFYYFVKSERNPEKDPLLIWLTGGTGCSAWSGLVYEIGPLHYKVEEYNGMTPTLVLNDYSWTKISNIIFVDAPVGTGFSYSKNTSAYDQGDFQHVDHLFQFFKKWLINHPEFISNPLYIAGDSYSGIIVPMLAQQISNGIKDGTIPPINLEGYILGNPATYSSDNNYKVSFAHRTALISDEQYQSLEKNCRGQYYGNIDPKNIKCLKVFHAYEKSISGLSEGQILESLCHNYNITLYFKVPFIHGLTIILEEGSAYYISDLSEEHAEESQCMITSKRRSLTLNSDDSDWLRPFGCSRIYDQLLSFFWANDPRVREALHIPKGRVEQWKRCNDNIQNKYKKEVLSTVEYHANLSAKGYRSLIYSGDHDMMVPYLGTQAWIKSLNYTIVDDWRPWIVHDQVAGFTRSYSNKMTFATIKGAGHTAPQYKPKECFAMFKRWIHYEPL